MFFSCWDISYFFKIEETEMSLVFLFSLGVSSLFFISFEKHFCILFCFFFNSFLSVLDCLYFLFWVLII